MGVSWQQDAVKDLGTHGTTLEEVHTSLSRAHAGIAGAIESMQGIKGEVGIEQESLKKLAARVDQCYKYFNGFGKGLQETHRQILNTESSMLPPKLGGAMLPTLPTAPKTPRGSLPTPRRGKAAT